MTSMHHTKTQQSIIWAATQGFMQHGYHGYSMQACADSVDLQKGSLYHYVKNKADLAHQVLAHITEQACAFICQSHVVSFDTVPTTLIVLPLQLWPANQVLQTAIQSYFQDWQIAFLDSIMATVTKTHYSKQHQVLQRIAREQFLRWLGLGIARFLQLSVVDSVSDGEGDTHG